MGTYTVMNTPWTLTMLHLYLIRHADAVPREDPNFADDDRPLTELGKRQAQALGAGIFRAGECDST